MMSKRTRAGAAGALLLTAAVAVNVVGAPGGAQTPPAQAIASPGTDSLPVVSDDGNIVVFRSVDAFGAASIQVHNRLVGTTSPLVGAFPAGVSDPRISGNGCLVSYIVPGVAAPVDPTTTSTTEPPTDTTATPTTATPTTATPTSSDPSSAEAEAEAEAEADAGSGVVATTTPAASTTSSTTAIARPDVVRDVGGVAVIVSRKMIAQAADVEVPAEVRIVDRCAAPAAPVTIALAGAVDASAAVLSLDGSVLAVTDGNDVIRFVRSTTGGYIETHRFDGAGSSADVFVDGGLDISDDGTVIVFSAGSDPADIRTLGLSTWDAGVIAPLQMSAVEPTISGDGRVVAFQDVLGVSILDRENPSSLLNRLAIGATNPRISADGAHLSYESDDSIRVTSWLGGGDVPFDVTETSTLDDLASPTVAGVDLDRVGATIVADVQSRDDAPETDISISVRASAATFASDTFDLGSGDIGEVLSSTVTFTNDGPASIGVASVEVEDPFRITSTTCVPTIRPGSTCSITIEFTVEFFEDAFGVVTLLSSSTPATMATTDVVALGAPDVPATAATTTTVATSTTGGTTTGGTTTGGTTTGGATTGGTTTGGATAGGTTTGGTTAGGTTTGRRTTTTSGSTTGGRTRNTTTTTTTVPGDGVDFSPSTFEFAPTIAGAGRRTATIDLVNSSPSSVSISGVVLEAAAAVDSSFEIVSTTCASSIPAAGRCTVDVAFTPSAEGAETIALTASLVGGGEIVATVSGVGAPPPTLQVVPGVATVGQVVTLRGSGFPTGVTVSLSLLDDIVDQAIVVDEAGTFDIPIVVLPNTPQGPIRASVDGIVDQFAEVTAAMVVTSTSDRSSPDVLDGVGPSVGR